MKKIYFLLLLLSLQSYFCDAQKSDSSQNKVEVIKMAYITRELDLTPEDAQKFWPVYNNYTNELKQARLKYQNDEVGFEEKAVEIKKRYQGNFKKILNNDGRVNKLYTADKGFNNMLRNNLQNRQKIRKNFPQQQPQRQPIIKKPRQQQ